MASLNSDACFAYPFSDDFTALYVLDNSLCGLGTPTADFGDSWRSIVSGGNAICDFLVNSEKARRELYSDLYASVDRGALWLCGGEMALRNAYCGMVYT